MASSRINTSGLVLSASVMASKPSSPAPGSTWSGMNPWCYDWQGDWQQQTVSVPAHDGTAALDGTEFAPAHLSGRVPAVAILHGLGGKQFSVWWIARYLAGH